MTTKEVAERTGLSIRRVQQGAVTLKVAKHGRDWWWDEKHVKMLVDRIGKKGDHLTR